VPVKLGWKSLIGTNTLAYYESLLITDKKDEHLSLDFTSFINLFSLLKLAILNAFP
jgi:hypothetical protein